MAADGTSSNARPSTSSESASSADSGSADTATRCGLLQLCWHGRSSRMSAQVPTGERRAAIISGEFVPLTVEEFRNGYATFSDGLDCQLPRDPDFPTEYHDAVTGAAKPVEDTPFNRAWIAARELFADEAKMITFYQRVEKVMPIAADKKYSKYVDRQAGSFHIALLAAVAAVRFSFRTTPKALRAAFDAEFRLRLAAAVRPRYAAKLQ